MKTLSTQPHKAPKRRRDKDHKDLYQAPNGTFYMRYWSPKLQREIERSLGTDTKAKALKERKRILENIGEEKDRNAIGYKTFAPLARTFKDKRNWKTANTKKSAFNQIDNHIIPWFGNYTPDRVNNDLWVQYAKERRVQDPNCSLLNVQKYLTAILNWAHAEGIIKKKPRLESFDTHRESPGRVVSSEEFKSIFIHLRGDYADIAMIGWQMGMRVNEIKKLSWDRVDLQTREFVLRKIDTKNRKARRPVMTQTVYKIILDRAEKYSSISSWVFPNDKNPSQHYSNSDFVWQEAKKKAGVECRFHDLRHTWLTRAFRESNKYAEICEYAGLDLSEALGTYVEFGVAEMKAVSEIFSGKIGESQKNVE